MDEETSFFHHPLVSLVGSVFNVLLWFLSWMKALVAFATITIPRLIYATLSYSMTLTLNFWSFAIMFVLSAIALNYWIRWKYLNDYMRLKEQPLEKTDTNQLHPDVNTTEPPPAFQNYLDEFLQAVRVFGFLEKPVFHELARHLQTRRLIAGDSISLDQDKSFYCVVDGTVQVFAHTGQVEQTDELSWDDENMNGYQLINEVGSGGTLSSLFTILSLFTEDVPVSWQGDQSKALTFSPARSRMYRSDSDVSRLELSSRPRGESTSSAASTVHAPRHESFSLPGTPDGFTESASFARPNTPLHSHSIARATEDSTLAVIPAEAFRRLTKRFPKATGHIVQVIVTRFSRVTFNAAHRYLGLTTEVLRTEKAINDIACHPLPASFYEGSGLQQLRHRFDKKGAVSPAEEDYFTSGSQTDSPMPFHKHEHTHVPSDTTATPLSRPHSGTSSTTHSQVHAGDLHSSTGQHQENIRLTRTISHINTPHIGPLDDSPRNGWLSGDEFDLKDEVMACIAKSIGLLQPSLSGSISGEVSPAVTASEIKRSSSAFNSTFSSLSLLDQRDDGSSITGASTASSTDYMNGLDNKVEILFFPAGSTLVHAGEVNTGLFYVIDGFLDIYVPGEPQGYAKPEAQASAHHNRPKSSKRPRARSKLLFTVKPGGIAGYLASLCSTASYVDIRAKTDVYVGFLPSQSLERLLERQPIVLLTLAKRLISMLSPFLLHIDASLEWMHVNAGQVLWRPQDESDSFYIVINGRLRAIEETDNDGDVRITAEYGQGDTVGELDVITKSPRRNTVHAIRDTELIRMPQTLFNAISARNPGATSQLLGLIASRVRREVDSASGTSATAGASEMGRNNNMGKNNSNLKTVAILPVNRHIPINAFAKKLHAALESIGASTAYLNQESISSHLGRHVFTRMGKLKAAGWLADQEQRYRTVLYVADSPVSSSWTQTCIRQADFVLVVGMGDDPSLGEYERLLLSMKTTARKELVLLHPDRSVVPGSTREWLKTRPWAHQHLHVELPGLQPTVPKPIPLQKEVDAVTALKNLKDKVQSGIQKYRGAASAPRPLRHPNANDFARLARRLVGQSVGLVLGGGGARGISHLGVIRALEEHGVPIDHIGGTSIGAFIGGLYAHEGDILISAGRAKLFSSRMGNIWRMLSDVTYPIVAYTTGHEFNRSIYKSFYDLHIEDMWLPFFCNTTNILHSRMEIHETGYAWRFIRASMSLVGLLPPLCDNGHMLVDGGYMDNLPVSAMLATGASSIIASDVGSIDDNSPRNFGDSVSGWWLLLNKLNPFSSAYGVPAITEIQSRLAYVSSVKTLEEAKKSPNCLYMAIPVQEYATMGFNKFEEIQQKGYDAAIEMIRKWEEESGGKLPLVNLPVNNGTAANERKKGRARRSSI